MNLAIDLNESLDSLDENSLKICREELNESDEFVRESSVKLIKIWLKEKNYSNFNDSWDNLIRFLRVSKYNVERAKLSIEKHQNYTNELKSNQLNFNIAKYGFILKLPLKDQNKRNIVIHRPGALDPTKFDFNELRKFLVTNIQLLCKDPCNQIHGIIILIDYSGLSLTHALHMTPNKAMKLGQMIQGTFPLRIREIHFFNYPKIFDPIYSIAKLFLSEKITKRIYFHGSNLLSLQNFISRKYLPNDYNGELDSIQQINENWTKFLKSQPS